MKRQGFTKPYFLDPQVMAWVESCASCAIEGNEWAIEMCKLWREGKHEEFVKQLEDCRGV